MSFLFIHKILRLNSLKTRKVTDVKVSVFVICVEAIIYLLLYNLSDCTIKSSFILITGDFNFRNSNWHLGDPVTPQGARIEA